MKMPFSLLSISMQICYLNPRLKTVSLGADLRWVGRAFHILLAEKKKIWPQMISHEVRQGTAHYVRWRLNAAY